MLPPVDFDSPAFEAEPRERLARHLRTAGLVEGPAYARAEQVAIETNQPVEQVLNQMGALTDDALAAAYAEVGGLAVWDEGDELPQVLSSDLGVSVEYLRRRRVLPLRIADDRLVCAVCDPFDAEGLQGLTFAARRQLEVLVARPGDFRKAFAKAYPDAPPVLSRDRDRLERDIARLFDSGVEGAGSRLVSEALDAAIAQGASDIHLEPRRNDLLVRLRLDGKLVNHATAPLDLAASAVSRVKVIANLDLGEQRLPQDGRTSFVVQGRSIDVRVATSPTVFGETAVLRLLDRDNVPLELEALGLWGQPANVLRQASELAHGLFLISGPTGSGKTTTLYALLQRLAGSDRKILSVEDPVEYHFEHVSQTQVAPQIGLTFATALRSFLRQDPDIILVGEIRDPETAAVATQAAMTGHLVLASVHANDARGIIPRLLDMGIEPFQLAAGLKGAAAQRLVRRLCPSCRRKEKAVAQDLVLMASLGVPQTDEVFRAVGCDSCHGTGFKGRVAIAEAFLTTEAEVRQLVGQGGVTEPSAWRPMALDGANKAEAGWTTLQEVLGAVGE